MEKKLFINGKIFTASESEKWVDCIGVTGNKISFIGNFNDHQNLTDEYDQIIDLNNHLVLPGFIDCHTHFAIGGFSLKNIDYSRVTCKKDFEDLTENYVKNSNSEWIVGGNWNNNFFDDKILPHKNWVDKITGEHPYFASRADLHMALANSKGLEIAGIDKFTPDPPGGIIHKDKNGEVTGLLIDSAMRLVQDKIGEPEYEDYLDAINRAMDEAKKNGVTSVHDIIFNKGSNAFEVYQKNKNLTCRINLIFPLSNIKEFSRLGIRNNLGNEKVRIGALKSFADGSLGSHTAWLFDDYKNQPGNKGLPTDELQNGELKKLAIEADLNQNQLMIHAIGDRACSKVIDIIEEIRKLNPEWDRRPRIEHLQHLKEKDLKRLSENGIIASLQPQHLFDDGVWLKEKIEEKNYKDVFRVKSLLENGVKICFGSDWTVAPLEPIKGIYTAVTRKMKDPKLDPMLPDEAISVEDSVKAYTINAAFASYEEDIKGSLEVGKLADFIVLDKDIFEVDPSEIFTTNVVKTIMDGNIIYEI